MALKEVPFVDTKELPYGLLGILDNGELAVNQELNCTDRQATLKKLVNAQQLGYDSCVVTGGGTYATKKLNP
ncbi:MAG: hypothetical protein C4562_01125 [Actinobacteria bacterium]|nr:MAG: hypothetical protein C4562_01125 [Actinomycetota bacterium]